MGFTRDGFVFQSGDTRPRAGGAHAHELVQCDFYRATSASFQNEVATFLFARIC